MEEQRIDDWFWARTLLLESESRMWGMGLGFYGEDGGGGYGVSETEVGGMESGGRYSLRR